MDEFCLGVISDTHDLLRPAVFEALSGVREIIHGGDVCKPEILEQLRTIAPLRAVRGNCDRGEWASKLPHCDTFRAGPLLVHAVHDLNDLELDPAAAGLDLVIYGHSHQPKEELRRGVLYLNPGSAGPRRFTLPITLARVTAAPDAPLRVEFVDLE